LVFFANFSLRTAGIGTKIVITLVAILAPANENHTGFFPRQCPSTPKFQNFSTGVQKNMFIKKPHVELAATIARLIHDALLVQPGKRRRYWANIEAFEEESEKL
jgi:hypothetical protein